MRVRLIAVAAVLLTALLPNAANAAAAGDGLLGTYYDQNGQQRQYFTGTTVVQVDPVIDFDWGNGAPTAGIGADDFSVRWTGEIEMPNWNGQATRQMNFRTRSDDGVRVYINGVLVINNWTDHGPAYDTGQLNLTRNQRYPIVIEFYERGGGAVIEFEWDLPTGGTNWETVPQAYLYSLRPPRVASITSTNSAANPCGDPRMIIVNWDIPVVGGGGANAGDRAANFSISGGPAVTGATLSADGLTTTLTLAADLVGGASYSLVVSNVRSTVGGTITPNPSSYPFALTFGVVTPGLRASYYPALNFGGTAVERTDAQVNFDWGVGNPGITGFPVNQFSVRWEGYVTVPSDYAGEFFTRSDDGVRLWINNVLVVDNWTDHSATENRAAVALTAGQTYPIRLEFYENGGDAVIQLGWQRCTAYYWVWCTATADEPVPASALSHCRDPNVLDGFLIGVASGTASTCAPLNVSIAAQDSAGNTLTGFTGMVALETMPIATTHGDWSLVTGNGALNNGAVDDGQATYTFVSSDNGAVTLALSNQHADDLAIRVTDVMSGTASASGVISFRDNAFVIASADAVLGDVPVAGRPHSYTVTMMRRDPGTGNCGAAAGYQGTKALRAWVTPDAAHPAGALAPALNGASALSSVPAASPAGNNFSLNFTAGVASMSLATADVGKYSLHLLDTSRDFANAVDIGGMSNMQTVRPFAISVRQAAAGSVVNPQGASPTDPVFIAAGDPFEAVVAGVLWSGVDDGDGNGVPDAGADLDDNGITPAFANNVSLSPVLNTPATGTVGVLTPPGPVDAGSFASGSATVTNLRYSEVGSLRIAASSASYLGTPGASIAGTSNPVGRFVPAYLAVTTVQNACGAFTYARQPFTDVSVTAYNALNAVTVNYFGVLGNPAESFAKYVTFSDASGATAHGFVPGRNGISYDAFAAGEGTTADATFAFDTAQTAPLSLVIRATDEDGVNSAGYDGTPVQVRSGRLRILDHTASSLTQANPSVLVEDYEAGGWDVNDLDACTPAELQLADFALGPWNDGLPPGSTAPTGFSMTAGSGVLTLSPPNATGSVTVTANAPDWLRFDWNGSGVEDPQGTVEFRALFETEDGFIDRREVY